MNSSRRGLWFLLAAGAAGILIVALLGPRLTVRSSTPLTGCIVDPGSGGGLGLARWAKRLSLPMQALDAPVWESSATLPRATGNCIITMGNADWGPPGHELTDDHWSAIHQWLAAGNTLIIVTASPWTLPAAVNQDIPRSLLGKQPTGVAPLVPWSSSVKTDKEKEQIQAWDLGRLSVAKEGPRGEAPNERLWERMPDGRPRTPAELEAARWQWAADERGVVLYHIPINRGAIYLLLDDTAWTNAGLDQGENAKVLAGILRTALRGGVLAIDEYRHGHGRAESFLTFLVNLPGARSVLWLGLLWGLFYFVSRNYRLEPLRPFERVERRTAREYIDAVAQMHERARAAPLAVEAVARRFRHLQRGSAAPGSAAERLLARAEEYVSGESRPARPTQSMKLVNELIRLRKQLYGSRTIS